MAAPAVIILAAGKGTRMKSPLPKVLHALDGRPMIRFPVDLARKIGADPIVVVVGHGGELVRAALQQDGLTFVTQEPQLGTGHAVSFTRELLHAHPGQIVILSGDVPLLMVETLMGLLSHHRAQGAQLTVLVAHPESPSGYGRILRDRKGRVLRIVEEGDATADQRTIREVNAGTYCVEARALFMALEALQQENAQGEYYLTDIVEALAPDGVATFEVSSPEEMLGINDRADLAEAEKLLEQRLSREDTGC